MAERHYDLCVCGVSKKRTSAHCRRCANENRGQQPGDVRDDFGYYPKTGNYCLIAVRGFSERPSGIKQEQVHFTLCENFAPFHELLRFPLVNVANAESKRTELIRQYCAPNYHPDPRARRLQT